MKKLISSYSQWLKDAGIRATKTMAQSALALIPASVTITDVNWKTVVSTAVLAGIVSILMSLKGISENEEEE